MPLLRTTGDFQFLGQENGKSGLNQTELLCKVCTRDWLVFERSTSQLQIAELCHTTNHLYHIKSSADVL